MTRVWNAEARTEAIASRTARDSVNSVAYSPDGQWIVTGSEDGTIRVWNAQSGARRTGVRRRHPDHPVTSVAYSIDGRQIASGSRDQGLLLWDADTGADLRSLCRDASLDGESVESVTYSADGRRIAIGSGDGTISVYDAESCAELADFRGHEGPIRCVAYSPDGRWIASGSTDRTIRVWDTEKGDDFTALSKRVREVRSVTYSPDGQYIAIAGDWHTAFHARDAKPASPTISTADLFGLSAWDSGIRVTKTPNSLIAELESLFAGDSGIRVCDTEDDTEVAVLVQQCVGGVAYSPDGRRIAGGSDRVNEWDAENGMRLRALFGHKGYIASLAYSFDGRRIASAYYDGALQNGTPKAAPNWSSWTARAAAFRIAPTGGRSPAHVRPEQSGYGTQNMASS